MVLQPRINMENASVNQREKLILNKHKCTPRYTAFLSFLCDSLEQTLVVLVAPAASVAALSGLNQRWCRRPTKRQRKASMVKTNQKSNVFATSSICADDEDDDDAGACRKQTATSHKHTHNAAHIYMESACV